LEVNVEILCQQNYLLQGVVVGPDSARSDYCEIPAMSPQPETFNSASDMTQMTQQQLHELAQRQQQLIAYQYEVLAQVTTYSTV
jgi:hypothetical protein